MSSDVDLTLLVGYRVGRELHAGPIDISGDVRQEFAGYAELADAQIGESDAHPHFELDSEYIADSTQILSARLNDIVDLELIELLGQAHVNSYLSAQEVRDRRPHLYALSVVKAGARSVYVRATSPVKFPGKGIRGVLTDSFTRITDPFLVFDSQFDFVIRGGEEILIFNPSAFERITNSVDAAVAASKRLVSGFGSALKLPIAEDGLRALERHLSRNSFLRRKMLSVTNKGYLKDLTAQKLTDVLGKHELALGDFLDGEQLVVTEANVKTLLSLLNDDVFAGDFSGREYTAERKSAL